MSSTPDYAQADEEESTFRCGSTLVGMGESNYAVLDKCGPPNAKAGVGLGGSYGPPGDSPALEAWVCNRGPTDFVYRLKLQSGSLVNIYRGARESRNTSCIAAPCPQTWVQRHTRAPDIQLPCLRRACPCEGMEGILSSGQDSCLLSYSAEA